MLLSAKHLALALVLSPVASYSAMINVTNFSKGMTLDDVVGVEVPSPSRGTNNYLVLAIHHLGLANRLRILASGLILAQETNRTLLLDWRPDDSCNATYTDLFERPPTASSSFSLFTGHQGLVSRLTSLLTDQGLTVALARLPDLPAPPLLLLRPDSVLLDIERELQSAGFSASEAAEGLSSPVWVVASTMAFLPHHLTCQDFFARKQAVYQHLLRPVPAVMVRVSALTSSSRSVVQWPHSSRLLVGVHVRSHDDRHDWPVVAPQAYHDDRQEAVTFDDVSSPSLFASVLSSLLARQPKAAVFIASNNRRVKLALERHVRGMGFPVVGDDGGGNDDEAGGGPPSPAFFESRTEAEGVQRALSDLVVLSGCHVILHSFGSSFGEEAAAWNLVPSVRVRAGGSILGVDLSRPHCHSLLLYNARREAEEAEGPHEQCYEQRGRGRVCTLPVDLQPCEGWGHAWGLTDVYCLPPLPPPTAATAAAPE